MRMLITEAAIQERVCELGARISERYAGQSLTILGVLTGSIVLLADLIRATTIPLRVALIEASSYGGTRTEPGEVMIDSSLVPDLTGRNVVILDDIFDTGKTMVGLYEAVEPFAPASIRSAVLLWKKDRTIVNLQPDYFCFQIPDEFVVGYGLDYNDEFRNLPFIGVPDDHDLHEATSVRDV
ncbi:MAG: hypoxanthine phosphoribosyltransferase [Planctomycetaceae bacterium]|jgi:hypoxanthine phosphoribosyltransferase